MGGQAAFAVGAGFSRKHAKSATCGRQGRWVCGGKKNKKETYDEAYEKSLRVDPNSSISLKKQLWFVKETEKKNAEGGKPVERTSFRKKKGKARTSSSADIEESEYVRVPKGKYDKKTPPIVFVDGYNVIGYWPRLRKLREKNELEKARKELNEEVRRYCKLRGWEAIIVYDAMMSEKRGVNYEVDDHVSVVFTGDCTADTFIEVKTKEHVDMNERQVWAATSDMLQQKMAYGNGAHIMSSNVFVKEIKRTSQEAGARIQKHNKRMEQQSFGALKYALSEADRLRLVEKFGGNEMLL